MARPVIITKSLDAAVANAIATAQAVAGAGNLTLDGALVSGGVATVDSQRRIGITSSGNDTGITFTVYGTMESGVSISEVVTGSNGSVASTLQDFYTVTRVAASGAAAGTVAVGTTPVGSSPWFVPNQHITPFEIGLEGELLSAVDTTYYSVEATQNSPIAPHMIYQAGWDQTPPVPTPFQISTMTQLTVNAQGAINATIAAFRLTLTLFDGESGSVRLTAIQSGIRN